MVRGPVNPPNAAFLRVPETDTPSPISTLSNRMEFSEPVTINSPIEVKPLPRGTLALRRPPFVPVSSIFVASESPSLGKDRLALTATSEVDILQFHGIESEAARINIGEGIRTAAARLLDMGQDDLQLLLVQKSDTKPDLVIYDPMPGGSGPLEQMLTRWKELIATAKEMLAGCVQNCETACYACLKTFRNQFHHALLNRYEAVALMEELDYKPQG